MRTVSVIPALATYCGKVWLTVSSLWRPIPASDKVVDSELEVNWDLDCPLSPGYPDTIKVFAANPEHGNKIHSISRDFLQNIISFRYLSIFEFSTIRGREVLLEDRGGFFFFVGG